MPTKLFKQTSILEMLGFSFNPDEKKYIYVKPGTAGFCKTYSEEHGIERVVQFLKERRYDSRGDSENQGLVLATQVGYCQLRLLSFNTIPLSECGGPCNLGELLLVPRQGLGTARHCRRLWLHRPLCGGEQRRLCLHGTQVASGEGHKLNLLHVGVSGV